MTPALVGITPYMGLNFAIYELMKGVLKIDQPPPSIPSQPITSKKNKSAVDRILSKQPSSSSPIDKFLNQYQSEIASIKKIGQKFLCGGLAGGVSKLAVYPLDTIKKRLQTQGLRSSLSTGGTVGTSSMNVLTIHYNGIVDCFQKVIRTEGFKGLYKVY